MGWEDDEVVGSWQDDPIVGSWQNDPIVESATAVAEPSYADKLAGMRTEASPDADIEFLIKPDPVTGAWGLASGKLGELYQELPSDRRQRLNQILAERNPDALQLGYEQTFREQPLSNALTRGAQQAALGAATTLRSMGNRLVGDWGEADQLELHQAARERATAAMTNRGGAILTNVASTLTKALAAGATGSTPAVIGTFVYDSMSRAWAETHDKSYALTQGAIEGAVTTAFNLVGLGGLEKTVLRGAPWQGIKTFAKQMASELVEEEIVGLGQAISSQIEAVDPKALKQFPQQAIDIAIQTMLTMGAAKGVQSVNRFLGDPSRRNADRLGIGRVVKGAAARAELAASVAENAGQDAADDSPIRGLQNVREEREPKSPGQADSSMDGSTPPPDAPESPPTQPPADEPSNDRYRGLANRSTDPTAREATYELDVEMGVPETRARSIPRQAAEARIAADLEGETERFMADIAGADPKTGYSLASEEDAVTLDLLAEHYGSNISDPQSRETFRTLKRASRQGRTEAARLLGVPDPLNKPVDREDAARKALGEAIASESEERYQEAKEHFGKQGVDIDDTDAIAHDPVLAMKVLDFLAPPSSKWDVAYEYWRNAILSGPHTQATNVIGNSLFAGWHLGPERAVEAAVNLFVKDPKGAQLGEFKHLLGGILPGMRRGWRNATKAWRLETSALAEELGREGAYRVEGARHAIKGKVGRLVRAMGYRPLLAADEFAKSVVATMEAGAHAYRTGKAQGLAGDALQAHVGQQVNDLRSESWTQALSKAEQTAFQGRHGVAAQAVSGAGSKLRSIRGVRWVVPFVDTPAAILEEGLKRTPIVGAILDYAEARRGGANIADAGMTPTLARQIIALGAMAMLWSATDDEDPWITGAAVLSDQKARELGYRTAPPMSIRLGDTWVSYARVEPFATALAWTVDAIRGVRHGRPTPAILSSSVQQLKNKSFLDGIGDVMDSMEGIGTDNFDPATKFAGKFASSWVPNLWRQTVASTKGVMPENRVWGKGSKYYARVAKRAAQAAQIPGVSTQPRYDVWGRPIRYSDSVGAPATDFFWRLLSPVKTKDLDDVQRADLALMRWNAQNPDDTEIYSEVPKYVTVNRQTKYLSDEQHAQYAQLAGELSRNSVSSLRFNSDKPTAPQIASIKRALERSRATARQRLLPQWHKEWNQ